MQYILVIAKEVAFPPQAFVATWNADPTCRKLAEAAIDCSTKAVYEPDSRVPLPLLEVTDKSAPSAAILASIQKTFQKKYTHQPTEIIQLEKPNGQRVLLIKQANPQ